MQKFSEFLVEHKALVEAKKKEESAHKFNELYEAKLKEFGVDSPVELNEEQSKEFFEYLKTLKNSTSKMPVNEKDITDEKTFREYALEVLKKAHPDDFDQKIADKVINDIASKVKDGDWGAAVGRLTSGLGK
jgi:hypothetical protein